jgi:hypothetical protein
VRALLCFSFSDPDPMSERFFFMAEAACQSPESLLPFPSRVALPVAIGSSLGLSPQASADLARGLRVRRADVLAGDVLQTATMTLPCGAFGVLAPSGSLADLDARLLAALREATGAAWIDPARMASRMDGAVADEHLVELARLGSLRMMNFSALFAAAEGASIAGELAAEPGRARPSARL